MQKRSQNARDEKGKWEVGGGGLEHGDLVENTLRKEITEELGAEAKTFEFLGFRDVHRAHDDRPTHWVALDFKVLVDPAEVRNNEPNKFEDVRWFSWGTMPPLAECHSQTGYFMEKYKNQLQ